MRVTCRPLFWDRPLTPVNKRRSRGAFKATWSNTLGLLEHELTALRAESIVLMADFREQDIRLDGLPRASAKQPDFPGVKIGFDTKHGRLSYATDVCEFWQHNVRSIALGLEALRAVDRYGISASGEQYTGYKALDMAMPSVMTEHEAWGLLAQHAGLSLEQARYVGVRDTFRRAARRAHPDTGGDASLMAKLNEALSIIERTARD